MKCPTPSLFKNSHRSVIQKHQRNIEQMFEDTQGVIISHNSKNDRQYNVQR